MNARRKRTGNSSCSTPRSSRSRSGSRSCRTRSRSEAEHELLRAENETLRARAGELAGRVDQLESAAAAVDARIERERQGFEDQAATQRDQASSERERLARRLVEREEELRNAQRALAAARAESEGANVELRSLRKRVEELNRADARRREEPAPTSAAPSGDGTPNERPARQRRRKPIDELELLVGDAPAAPSLFADQPAEEESTSTASAESATSVMETPAELEPFVQAVAEAVAEAERAEVEAETEADAEVEERTEPEPVAAHAPTPTEEDALPTEGAAEPEPHEEPATPAETLEALLTEVLEEPRAEEVEVALIEDEPEVIIKPHRAAPPSMPTFPGVDAAEAPAKQKASKANAKPATKVEKPAPAAASKNAGAEPASAADDFTRIRGIGPRTADKLVAAGIRSFADFAALSGDALTEIADAIGVGASKIKSSGWQKSARRLAKSKR